MLYRVFFLVILFVTGVASAQLTLKQVPYSQLTAWQENNFQKSMSAFKHSCIALNSKKFRGNLSSQKIHLGKAWRLLCEKALAKKKWRRQQARHFFENNFLVYRITDGARKKGLATGYFLPVVKASLKRSVKYSVPIYARPRDLVSVRLGWFSPKWRNEKISGRVIDGHLYPYRISRTQINHGAIKHLAPVIAWVHSRVDRFFLQIQGSGFLQLKDGKRILLGYDGENGFDYYSIGKWFVAQHIFTFKTISMQRIRQWLVKHPAQANRVMALNPSFIFFKVLKSSVPFGTNHIPLTAAYSVAVDSHSIPLGVPLYLAGDKIKRLFITQDTGGAIRGPLRVDVYWGGGAKAEKFAGHMRSDVDFYILLPRMNSGLLNH